MKRFAFLFLSLTISIPAGAETIRVLAFKSDVFFYEKDGQPEGIEYRILQYFAKTRGDELHIEWVSTFPELLSRMEKGEADIGAGTITETPERRRRFGFSAAYFPVQVLVVAKADANYEKPRDLAGERVGAYRETTAEKGVTELAGAEVVYINGLEGMFDAVLRGEIQAVAADSSAIIPALENYPTLKVAMALGEEEHFAFALAPGSSLGADLSEHIARLKESGVYLSLIVEQLGPRAAEIVRVSSKLR